MSIIVNTAGNTSYLRRSTTLGFNSAYTVIFRYYSTGSHSGDFLWACTVSASTGGGLYPASSNKDEAYFAGAGGLRLLASASATNEVESSTLSTGWHSIAIVRSSSTAIKLRLNGTNYTVASTDVSGRSASAYEFMLGRSDDAAAAVPQNSRITNYKSWSSALSDAEVDAEFAATAFTVTSNKYSGSPMGDDSTLSSNLSADGSGTTWTAGAGLIAGANDPGVTYGSSFIPRRMMLGVG